MSWVAYSITLSSTWEQIEALKLGFGYGLIGAMKYVADLHIHSRFARACSKQLNPQVLYKWGQLKGITVLATGDFTHPAWMAELKEQLEPAEPGLYKLKPKLAKKMDAEIPESCRAPVRFLLGVEISSIYKKGDKVRKVHSLVYAPSFAVADKINKKLDSIGNIKSDGRPILGLDCKVLLAHLLDISEKAYLVPAHIWTPHFAVFGSESGFDSLEEAFEDLAPHIFAIETGLSSDPPMNWRIKDLDRVALMSNSDAHSPEKLAREANLFDTDLSYDALFDSVKQKDYSKFLGTLEFFPEEGKYHVDGHRKCQARLLPEETLKRKGLCPVCNRSVTVGVLHRIEKLAGRKKGVKPVKAGYFENIIPLKEILGDLMDVGPMSKRVDRDYHNLLGTFGSELSILRTVPLEALEQKGYNELSTALERMRKGNVHIEPGYDGEYGIISVTKDKNPLPDQQLSLQI